MAASTSVSSALLDGDGPIVVPGYSPSPASDAGLPMGLDPGLQAGFVVLSPFPCFSILHIAGLGNEVPVCVCLSGQDIHLFAQTSYILPPGLFLLSDFPTF